MKLRILIISFIVALFLYSCEKEPVESKNRAPEILSLISQLDSIKTLSSTKVTCTAIDPDGDSLIFMWSTGGAAITDSGSSIIVESPRSSGLLPVSCTVFDRNGGKDTEIIYLQVYGHHHHSDYSSEDESEAREIALWLGINLTYAHIDYYEVLWSINEIRYFQSVEYSFLDKLRFQLPWIYGQIVIGADSSTSISIKNDQYIGWEILSDSLRPTLVKQLGPGNVFLIDTEKFYNSWKLCEFYLELPGIMQAEPNFLSPPVFESIYPIFPVLIDGSLSYIFSWGNLYYFNFDGENPKYIGSLPYIGDPKPDWVINTEYFIQNFAYWGK